MRGLLVLAVLLWGSTASALSVKDVPNPRQNNAWVSDTANMIDSADESEINDMITAINASEGVEIAVVTVDSVSTPTPKDFATELFNYWGIGQKATNNGLLVVMVKSARRLEMETGYGLEPVLTDGWLKNMQTSVMIPAFKRGDFGGGLKAGVQASIAKIEGSDAIPAGVSPYEIDTLVDSNQSDGTAPWWWVLFGGLGVGAVGGGAAFKRRLDRTCGNCKTRMSMVPDDEDDEHLTEGQQTEEAIGSIDYELLYCESCAFTKMIANKKFFSGYSNCPKCAHRTASTSSHTIRSATTYSTGLEKVTTECANCSYFASHNRTIPRIVQTSSSSSSGGSSGGGFSSGGSSGGFSGGSSGGGGAGSSW